MGPIEDLPTVATLKAAVEQALPPKRPPQQVSSIDAWTEAITRMLERDAQPQAIYDCLRLTEPTFAGSLSAVKRLVQRLRGTQEVRPQDVVIPVRTAPGEIAQVDFGYARARHRTARLHARPEGEEGRRRTRLRREDNVRTGFFERADFEAVAAHLPPDLAAPMWFAYITGWRRNEVLTLQWRQVDFTARTVRLEPGSTKNKKGLVFTFTSELEDVLRGQDGVTREVQREQGRICPWVFHRRGKPIKDYYGAWRRACLNAGLGQRIEGKDGKRRASRPTASCTTSDEQRCGTCPRRGDREGGETMTGHKARSVFDRYDIVSPGDVERAAALLDVRRTAERCGVRIWAQSGHSRGSPGPR